jgi:multiple sugar transport system substrate-binding protein
MPRFHELALRGRPRPVTPYYLMLSTTVQPEFSAALVGVKTPEQALGYARRRLEYMLRAAR